MLVGTKASLRLAFCGLADRPNAPDRAGRLMQQLLARTPGVARIPDRCPRIDESAGHQGIGGALGTYAPVR